MPVQHFLQQPRLAEPRATNDEHTPLRGWGCRAVDVETPGELEQEFKTALSAGTTTVIVVRTQPQPAML